MEPEIKTDAQAIIDTISRLHGYQTAIIGDPRPAGTTTSPDSIPVAVLPEGLRLHTLKPLLDEYATTPERRSGTFRALDAASLISHANRFKVPETVLFAHNKWQRPTERNPEWVLPSVTAVYNYHRPAAHDGPDGAGWCDHRATYAFELSEPFKAWAKADKEAMSQGDLAAFLEDRCLDIAPPPITAAMPEDTDFDRMVKAMTTLLRGNWGSAPDLMDMARTIRIHENSVAEQKTDLRGGTGGIVFTNEHRTETGEIFAPPDLFMLSLPIFSGGDSFSLPVRLKYRLKQRQVLFFYEIFRLDIAFELAFREACQSIADQTNIPLMVGTPEH